MINPTINFNLLLFVPRNIKTMGKHEPNSFILSIRVEYQKTLDGSPFVWGSSSPIDRQSIQLVFPSLSCVWKVLSICVYQPTTVSFFYPHLTVVMCYWEHKGFFTCQVVILKMDWRSFSSRRVSKKINTNQKKKIRKLATHFHKKMTTFSPHYLLWSRDTSNLHILCVLWSGSKNCWKGMN